jgi:hypothetical protein
MVLHVRPLRATDGPRPRDWPSSLRSTAAGSGSRQPPKDQQRRRAYDSGPDLFDVGVIEGEPDPPHLGFGVGHPVDGQHLGRFHASLGPPAPTTARPSSPWPA